MTTSKLINYTTREFMSDHELEQYITKQNEIFTPKVVEEFTKAGMLRRVLTKLWNKEGVHELEYYLSIEMKKRLLHAKVC